MCKSLFSHKYSRVWISPASTLLSPSWSRTHKSSCSLAHPATYLGSNVTLPLTREQITVSYANTTSIPFLIILVTDKRRFLLTLGLDIASLKGPSTIPSVCLNLVPHHRPSLSLGDHHFPLYVLVFFEFIWIHEDILWIAQMLGATLINSARLCLWLSC